MQYVLTLTADPAHPTLDTDRLGAAGAALRDAGATLHDTEAGAGDTGAEAGAWLCPGVAADLFFTGLAADKAGQIVRHALGEAAIDANAQPASGRRKRLLIADMDSTIITGESLDDLAAFAGIRDQIAPLTARAMRGEIDFEEALRRRVSLLAGQPESLIDRLLADRITLTPGAQYLAATMRRDGAFTALVSGGFTAITGPVARRAGFETHRGNRLITAEGLLTGAVAEPIHGQEAKRDNLIAFCAARGLAPEDALAVGDGANDIAMLRRAGTGVAFRAKPAVRDAARFTVTHGDLTALLYLQGYRRADFVSV